MHLHKGFGSIFLVTISQVEESWCQVPLKPSFLKAEQAPFFQLLFAGQVFQFQTILVALTIRSKYWLKIALLLNNKLL